MTTVAHYVERWLDISAGFVAAHVEHSRHRGVVISRDGWANLRAFDHHPRYSLAKVRRRTPERLKATVLRAELTATLTASRADVIHAHFGYAAGDIVDVKKARPYVLSVHGHDITGLLHHQPDRYRTTAPAVDAVIVPSQFLATSALAAGFTDQQLRVIPSGIDTAFFRATPMPDNNPVVGFVGRFVAKKGIDTLMAAWPAIAKANPDATLHMLGDGPLRHLVPVNDPRIILELPDEAHRHEQVRDLIQRSTVMVTPSHSGPDGDSESLLLVNLEAAASGRPVVSTKHGGIPEYVVDGGTGLLVEPESPVEFTAAVNQVLSNTGLAASLAAAGPEHAAQWDVRACTARIDDLYDELLRDRK